MSLWIDFPLPARQANALYLGVGVREPIERLHVTLMFFRSNYHDEMVDRIKKMLAGFCAHHDPAHGLVREGVVFGDKHVVRRVYSPTLLMLRQNLEAWCRMYDLAWDTTWEYTPHVTVATLAKPLARALPEKPSVRITMSRLTLHADDETVAWTLKNLHPS